MGEAKNTTRQQMREKKTRTARESESEAVPTSESVVKGGSSSIEYKIT